MSMLISLLLSVWFSFANANQSNDVAISNDVSVEYYAMTYAVVEVTDEWVICVDFNGNEWAFENETKDWFVGDLVSAIMSDNGTDIIYDDEFVSVRYSGWIEGSWGYDVESKQPIVEFDE